ncbi:hypothetical protein RIF29_48159 [Crotalaria pallida]|uniref:Uncharacterized protein n=1 Tax=Crotalaria pallida TaxID=3830 RepID=A0AAN9DP24_CROPI
MSVKMRTTCTWTERPYEASLFPGIGFGLFLRSLGGGRRRPPSGGLEPSVRYHSGRARILTLCQDLRAEGQFQVDTHIDGKVWHLDVGSSPPGAVVGSKGWAVRPLKRYVSWVQNVVRQFGPYPVGALEH